ncbi:hypothetical protein, partial [Vibrio casei]|uniref:hypothetical protein n=1 Tax=Vibrio casei TaxID=673372 RepID=UPI003F99B715
NKLLNKRKLNNRKRRVFILGVFFCFSFMVIGFLSSLESNLQPDSIKIKLVEYSDREMPPYINIKWHYL